MAEKMYGFTHLISETKLLALIASNADEVKVDIFVPERRNGPKRLQNGTNGHAPQLMLEAPPARHRASPAPSTAAGQDMAEQWGVRKWGARQVILKSLYDNPDRALMLVDMAAEAAKFGMASHSISVALTPLVKEGVIERVANGQYRLSEKGIEYVAERTFSPASPPTAPAAPQQTTSQKANITATGCAMIWAKMADGKRHERFQFLDTFERAGLPRHAVGGCFAEMTKKGYLTRVDHGVYQLTAKGKKVHSRLNNDQHDQPEGQLTNG